MTKRLGVALLAAAAFPFAGASQASAATCPRADRVDVPNAEFQEQACLNDLSTRGTQRTGHTERDDWDGLHADRTRNRSGFPGLQVDGFFPDRSNTNPNNGYFHDSQFVIRLPNDWNGKVVITGAPGVRSQYANDFIISDFVLARGYAFASTDKGNTGVNFFRDGERPGDAVAEWHRRVTQLTRQTKQVVRQRYGRAPKRTYMTGISNGGYLTRYALENHPELYDGGVDWEGTLFTRRENLLTYLPPSLRNYPEFEAGSEAARRRIIRAGFEPGSEFLWPEHYRTYWDLTQRVYREEFDPGYDGALEAGIPFCQQGTPNCDANYHYRERPERVKRAIESVSNTGRIGKKMITLHGKLDALLPIDTDSNPYERLVNRNGRTGHRYYTIGKGNHVDSFYDDFKSRLRPMLPCYRASFLALERWVEDGRKPPPNQFVSRQGSRDRDEGVINNCTVGGTAEYHGRGKAAGSSPPEPGVP